MADNQPKVTEDPAELAAVLRDDSRTSQEKAEARTKLNEVSRQASAKRQDELSKIKDEDERKVLELYNKGVQNFSIAKEVYKFANADTVAQVLSIIRKHHASDYQDVETLKDYKGYVGL